MKEFPAKYNHGEIEKNCQENWYNSDVYHWKDDSPKANTYVIDTPPPTVSGFLHMGHIFSYTQADFIARYKRMAGFDVFYPIGFDDNGLPTEKLVEKTKNIRANSMPREEFISICNEVVKDAEEEFRKLFKSIGHSYDWRQEYQTISPKSRTISQMSFLDLFNKDLVYRSPQPTLWDPVDQTALAQADIVDIEMKSQMHDIIFKEESGKEWAIATSRPELLPACVAVFCNPNDGRYKHLIGNYLITPYFEVRVKVYTDEKVDIEKGTGLVMCCTFGDINDIHWWKTNNLDLKQIINKRGQLNFAGIKYESDSTTAKVQEFEGLKVKDARIKMVEVLKEHNLLTKSEDISHAVKCAERSGAPLEILITEQWSVKVVENKEEFIKKAKECNWFPDYMRARIENWINGLNWDWCISRQRYFGVPFPVWYSKRPGEEGKILLADKDQLPVDPLVDLPKGYTKDEVIGDPDVMDTWATSSNTPQLSSHGISDEYVLDKDRHAKLFPADLRPQAHEIIRTWAFYTIVKAHYHENSVPWKNLMISGWCLAADKTKMSKSKGNVVTPVSLIEEKGADVVRYWASNSRLGADIAYSESLLDVGKKLINKIFNASKFCAQYFKDMDIKESYAEKLVSDGKIYEVTDLWMLSKLNNAIKTATNEFEKYEYSFARMAMEDFFWNVFCDNYLEIIKARAYDPENKNPKGKLSAVLSLYNALGLILRSLAPFIPHITEEVYSILYPTKGSVHQRGNWPKYQNECIHDSLAESYGDYLVEILGEVRKLKAEKSLSMKAPVKAIIISLDSSIDKNIFEKLTNDLKNVTQSENIVFQGGSLKYKSQDEKISFDIEIEV
ncbi:MAG: valine--tRNA ligase [Alphaproteobacteria bacterium]|nr:valine--tRNA ligase [Alphaproteobacteria bacterium]OJV17246.1 MAG: valine--tRNA ligase [Alphaproteobacteria bacterium 33-17]